MAEPEGKPYGVKVHPLRVLVDPTALPREAFEINRIVGLGLAAEEVGFIALSIANAILTEKGEFGIYLYLLLRMVAATTTYMTQQVGK